MTKVTPFERFLCQFGG